jgi:hypothetical protein
MAELLALLRRMSARVVAPMGGPSAFGRPIDSIDCLPLTRARAGSSRVNYPPCTHSPGLLPPGRSVVSARVGAAAVTATRHSHPDGPRWRPAAVGCLS